MASSASSMNATTGSSAAGWGSVLGVNSGGKLGFGVLDIPEPNTIRLGRAAAEVPHLAKHRPGFPRISGDTLTTRAHGIHPEPGQSRRRPVRTNVGRRLLR